MTQVLVGAGRYKNKGKSAVGGAITNCQICFLCQGFPYHLYPIRSPVGGPVGLPLYFNAPYEAS